MKERPILFSGPMVRAILEGRKTQTRRVIACPRDSGAFVVVERDDGSWWPHKSDDGESLFFRGDDVPMACPYGVPGDRLWVRETFTAHWGAAVAEQRPGARRIESGAVLQLDGGAVPLTPSDPVFAFYRADGSAKPLPHSDWTPSIFMPRWACRLVLEISEIRVQRIKEISEADCIAEGIEQVAPRAFGYRDYEGDVGATFQPWQSYSTLWGSINAKRGYSWESNPWVWAITFRRVP